MIKFIVVAAAIFSSGITDAQVYSLYKPDTSIALDREREAAISVYAEYFEHMTRIPQGKVNNNRLNSFVADRFTADAIIELKIVSSKKSCTPEQYFNYLKGLYYGTRARYTQESTIKLPPASLEIEVGKIETFGKEPVLLIKVKQEMYNISKDETRKVIPTTEDRVILIKIITGPGYAGPKIKSITLEN